MINDKECMQREHPKEKLMTANKKVLSAKLTNPMKSSDSELWMAIFQNSQRRVEVGLTKTRKLGEKRVIDIFQYLRVVLCLNLLGFKVVL